MSKKRTYTPGTTITLRVKPALKKALESRAKEAGMSLNKYIVTRFQQLQEVNDNPYLSRELPRQSSRLPDHVVDEDLCDE